MPAGDAATTTDTVRTAPPTSVVADGAGLVVTVGSVAWALWMGRHLWWFSDEWNIMGTYPSGNLLEPFNGHLSLVPVALYQVLFHTVGVGPYLPYRLLGLACWALLGWTTWRWTRSELGGVVAACAVAAILWNEGGVTNVLFPFLLNFSLPLAALPAIWWHLDRAERGAAPRSVVAASLWLCVALATSGLGLMVAAAIGIELLGRRTPVRRFVAMAPGPVLWALWWLRWGDEQERSGDLVAIVRYAARMLWAGTRSLGAGNAVLGVIVAGGFAVATVACAMRRRLDARAVGALFAPLAFAVATAASRIGIQPEIPPDELRYRWAMAAFWVFGACALAAGWRRGVRFVDGGSGTDQARSIPPERSRRGPVHLVDRRVATLGVIAAAAVVGWGALQLHRDAIAWGDRVATAAPGLRANLWVAEQADAAGVVDPQWWMPLSFVRFTAADYLRAVDRLGSPLDRWDADDIGGVAEQTGFATEAFVEQFSLALEPPAVEPERCTRVGAPSGVIDVSWGSTVLVEAADTAVEVRIDPFRRVEHARTVGTVGAGEVLALRLPAVSADSQLTSTLVHVRGAATITVCAAD